MPQVPHTIVHLVETFDRSLDAYKNDRYNLTPDEIKIIEESAK